MTIRFCPRCGRPTFRGQQLSARREPARCSGCQYTPGRCRCAPLEPVPVLEPMRPLTLTERLHEALSHDLRGCEHPAWMRPQCERIAMALEAGR